MQYNYVQQVKRGAKPKQKRQHQDWTHSENDNVIKEPTRYKH